MRSRHWHQIDFNSHVTVFQLRFQIESLNNICNREWLEENYWHYQFVAKGFRPLPVRPVVVERIFEQLGGGFRNPRVFRIAGACELSVCSIFPTQWSARWRRFSGRSGRIEMLGFFMPGPPAPNIAHGLLSNTIFSRQNSTTGLSCFWIGCGRSEFEYSHGLL